MLMLVTVLEPNTKPLEVKLKVDTLAMLARPEPYINSRRLVSTERCLYCRWNIHFGIKSLDLFVVVVVVEVGVYF